MVLCHGCSRSGARKGTRPRQRARAPLRQLPAAERLYALHTEDRTVLRPAERAALKQLSAAQIAEYAGAASVTL